MARDLGRDLDVVAKVDERQSASTEASSAPHRRSIACCQEGGLVCLYGKKI